MKKLIIEINFLLLIFLSFSDLKSQSFQRQDSLIQILKITSFPVTNPPPQYVVEIKSDRTISFYNNLPENFSQNHAEYIKDWIIIDSITIKLDSADFVELEKSIYRIDLSDFEYLKKKKTETGVEVLNVGGSSDNYIIETSNQKIKFSIGANNEKQLSNSMKLIRNIIGELENKYKP
ncbi:MAG: hypothetical protein H8D45_18975 [Bacteroidetes bacterium]|nr:hypothetical protein [Bacteroidota bacterium]